MSTQESKHLRVFLDEVGNSVHCINTIVVGLSHLSASTVTPDGLNITWKPGNVENSSRNARRFAVRSAIVYAVESFFEYLGGMCRDKHWPNGLGNFNDASSKASKAERVSSVLADIPAIEREWLILTELSCHWRNKIVHAQSTANISSTATDFLKSRKTEIYNNLHHLDVNQLLADFKTDKLTLKDGTTLITLLIKCARAVDLHYYDQLPEVSFEQLIAELEECEEYKALTNQQRSMKRTRQIQHWLRINYSTTDAALLQRVADAYL
ncbi:hypothetical protein BTN82_19265 [Pseudomonas chlororaphis]|uniref:Uncharacterized protein n=1 Tax=Pseudomonas chlororaphis TaxID=587753 RepID=A0A1Q8EMQ7_9PSED|nr:hypothetical protein BTN82_19265 [Pseudomonas chlororaphis]